MIDHKKHCTDTSFRNLKSFSRLVITLVVLFNHATQAETTKTSMEASFTREQWHEKLGWNTSDCPLQPPSESNAGVNIFDFGVNTRIIEIECEHLTYQGSYLFYLQKANVVSLLSFEQFEAPDVGQLERYSTPLVTGLPTVLKTEQAMTLLRKYRGFGDCGQYLYYQIKENTTFLKQLRIQECSELFPKKPIPPFKWALHKFPKK
ncbi:MAG: hypothetical protein WCI11_15270 [Candidatus Methylumidiphilus sp.]|nr:hypothetical protein [Pseudomonadota bacterium]